MRFLVNVIVEAENETEALRKYQDGDVIQVGIVIRNPKPQPIEPEPWPTILLPLKLIAKQGDRGAGDIIARVIGPIGGDAFKLWYKATFGRDCGCGNRQDALNRRWPLP